MSCDDFVLLVWTNSGPLACDATEAAPYYRVRIIRLLVRTPYRADSIYFQHVGQFEYSNAAACARRPQARRLDNTSDPSWYNFRVDNPQNTQMLQLLRTLLVG